MARYLLILLTVLMLHPDVAVAGGLRDFVRSTRPVTARQDYALGRFKVPRKLARTMKKMHLGRLVRSRKVLQVNNKTLKKYTQATAKGYLEVVVPAGKGHVYFRHGNQVFDFYMKGLRVGPVRKIGSERYGFLVPLTSKQELKLKSYLRHMKKTRGKELGPYDFHGEKGFHCVSWIMRLTMGEKRGESLVKMLGGRRKHGTSMPRFAQFMLKKAKGVEAVVVYSDKERSKTQLGRLGLELMTSNQLRKAHADEIGNR